MGCYVKSYMGGQANFQLVDHLKHGWRQFHISNLEHLKRLKARHTITFELPFRTRLFGWILLIDFFFLNYFMNIFLELLHFKLMIAIMKTC